jgi:O-acetyl-ADP-ribose deacetylase (regulator of RNase III)
VIERTGSIWRTQANIIGHGVNVDGLMGAGIAVQFKDRFPENYRVYSERCAANLLRPGRILSHIEKDTLIINFASQDRPGRNARYDWLFSSLLHGAQGVSRVYGGYNLIAIPEIGCGIGGLEWRAVAKIILAVEAAVGNKVEFEVWHYDG